MSTMESQPPPPQQPPPYPAPLPPPQVPPHLAHVVHPQYALTPPPHPHMSLPISGMPVPMQIPVAHPSHHVHHLPSHPPLPHPTQHSSHHSSEPDHAMHSHMSQPQPHLPGPPPPQHPQLPALHPLPMPYYDPATKIARLEADLEKARHEIDRLRAKLAEYEKERAKIDSPKVQSRYWTPAEHKRFLEALQKFGPKDVRAIANYVGSRNATQVRTHAQKYFLRVAREAKNGNALQNARKRSMSESDLARVGRSVRTPPGSPMREQRFQQPVDARMTEVDAGPSNSLPPAHAPPQPALPPVQPSALQRPPFTAAGSPSKMEPLSVSSTKPPAPITPGVTGGKPPAVRSKMTDNTGINLLSLVASERKMETEKPGR